MKLLYCSIILLLAFRIAHSQDAPPADSLQVEAVLAKKYAPLFGPEWSKKFAVAWNASPETAKVLRGLNKVYFIAVGKETTAALMNFDSLGLVSFLSSKIPGPTDTLPRFTATLIRWAQFMEGKFGAVTGVMTKKIEYHGPMTLAFKYGFYFDKVAPVGRRIVETLGEKSRKKK